MINGTAESPIWRKVLSATTLLVWSLNPYPDSSRQSRRSFFLTVKHQGEKYNLVDSRNATTVFPTRRSPCNNRDGWLRHAGGDRHLRPVILADCWDCAELMQAARRQSWLVLADCRFLFWSSACYCTNFDDDSMMKETIPTFVFLFSWASSWINGIQKIRAFFGRGCHSQL